jgi:methyl-accepting chemotaxis protein
MDLRGFRIGTRLSLGFGLLLALTALMIGIGTWCLQEIGDATEAVVKKDLVKERIGREWLGIIESSGVRADALIKTPDPENQKYFKKQIASYSDRANEIQKQLEATVSTEEGRKVLDALLEQRKEFTAIRNAIFKMKEAGDEAGAAEAFKTKLAPAMQVYSERVHALVDHQAGQIDKAAAMIDHDYRFGRGLMLGLGTAALVLGVLSALLMTRSIVRPLDGAVAAAQAVAAGDLSGRIEVQGNDEIAQLQQALQHMLNSLLSTVRQVRIGADTIATASTEIAMGNLDLSSRTEEQASSLEETASAMEELTATVHQNADNARQASQLAVSASGVASEGGAVVRQVIDTMGMIRESSGRVVDIISVIDGIAFQTNILALNAAVEAARAGEQGRGFAVVASEVRNLAQRSAAAAKEIKALISDSVDKVGSGTRLVEQAGKTMDEVVESVRRVTDIVSEISAATQEQSAGIAEVNHAITEMDQVTQQNAALVEEAAAAAGSMQEQAKHLAEVVSVFKLNDAPGHAVASRAPRPVARKALPA